MDDLLPGFRFYPTEEELVSFYLHNKLNCSRTADIDRVIPVVDIYDYNPWDLPQVAEDLGSCPAADGGEQWFFFIPRQEREARGGRPNRLTTEGFWKATGSPRDIYSSNNCVNAIGRKRTMVFYSGRAPSGTKTLWKMNEYKAIHHHQVASSSSSSSSSTAANPQLREEMSLCRIYKKSRSSLWAFDRRPQVRVDQAAATDHHHHSGTTYDAATLMTYEEYQHMINTPANQTNPDSSISRNIDNIIPSQLIMSLENDNIINAFNEPPWDSQQFNRFDM